LCVDDATVGTAHQIIITRDYQEVLMKKFFVCMEDESFYMQKNFLCGTSNAKVGREEY
jgi:hypothetical protein